MVNGVSMNNVYSNYTIQTLKSCGKTANVVSIKSTQSNYVCLMQLYSFVSLSLFICLQTVKRPRKIEIPVSSKPSRAASQSNLLDQDPPRRTRRYSDDSDNRDGDRYRARSSSPSRNGYGNTLPLMSSGYKRLPHQDGPDKPIKTTLVKKKLTDGKTSGTGESLFDLNYLRRTHVEPVFTFHVFWSAHLWLSLSSCRIWSEAGQSDLYQAHDRYRPGCKGGHTTGGRPRSQGENLAKYYICIVHVTACYCFKTSEACKPS